MAEVVVTKEQRNIFDYNYSKFLASRLLNRGMISKLEYENILKGLAKEYGIEREIA